MYEYGLCGADGISGRDAFQVFLHPVCTGLLHAAGHMGIYVQREGRGVMAQVFLHGFDVVTGLQAVHGEGMPLRYNYDKPEKPRISRVFGYQARFFILFQPEKSSREVVIS